ncbi:hypothetical protein Ae168Ps1_3403 [Pseudonocardia sp. Ae168_Ps1]|uniref:DUF1707 SHOCT-like domain-containing protein n=1 Tax=unclassified Pseudonocardia TaxID=2619320 RepID=UPI0001FFEB91|nr:MULTISPECIES: DUF1707 domain-containing protein [unclassified Pseudonocardia]ALL74926.1 hypothetical protein AD006_05695 [Pseudonocardia sp. EC080610-09]ALL81948.1 hypothetical protein AD017_13515 [Pseudonocardia sp. EC080619-01]OLL75004.1 hypothetical protein Ae150APs1_3382 [Pseudonocardia sp. Ae150A_Ps1]OLL80997.1 hypothetical protein Ae168Ps1_3403 [Pseudonocardia sp. Ae168_Ps1]OLL84887.1 hypothetical protein Ae263Ps1_1942c [Pseudonocardia sp. Ae263_Ps1]
MGEQQGDDGKALIRVSDADRQETAERLKLAHDEGRLSLSEYDQRLQSAYAATVRADLDVLVADLPVVKRKHLPAVRAEKAEAEKAEATREYVKEWRSWAGVAVLLTGIWAVTSLAAGDAVFFWPVFPIGIWGAVLVAQLFWGGDDD